MDWKWEGTLWDFVDVVQWAMLMHRLAQDHVPDKGRILSNPDLARERAEAYGITRRAVVREMLRIGRDAEAMFKAMDAGVMWNER